MLAIQRGTKLKLTRLYNNRVLHETRFCYYRITKEEHSLLSFGKGAERCFVCGKRPFAHFGPPISCSILGFHIGQPCVMCSSF